jgi:hypothetical protein
MLSFMDYENIFYNRNHFFILYYKFTGTGC